MKYLSSPKSFCCYLKISGSVFVLLSYFHFLYFACSLLLWMAQCKNKQKMTGSSQHIFVVCLLFIAKNLLAEDRTQPKLLLFTIIPCWESNWGRLCNAVAAAVEYLSPTLDFFKATQIMTTRRLLYFEMNVTQITQTFNIAL